VTHKQAWPQASQQLNPALITRMLIPVQLYIFIYHIGTVFRIWIWYPLPNRTVNFFLPVLTTSSIVIDSSREWLHHRTVHCMINYEDLYFHVITLCSLEVIVNFLGKWFPPPWKKNDPYAYGRILQLECHGSYSRNFFQADMTGCYCWITSSICIQLIS